MSSNKNQHVVPHPRGWAVKSAGGQCATSVHPTQFDAISAARDIAINNRSEMLIHRPDRVVCGRGRDPTVSVSRCPTGSAPGQRYSPGQVDVLPAERRRAARDSPAGADCPTTTTSSCRSDTRRGPGVRPAAPRASAGRGRRPGQRPRPARRFPSASDRTGPRRGGQPAQAPRPERTGARRASRADWPEPAAGADSSAFRMSP